MHFVKTDDLLVNMKLARPIFNKKGEILYGRGTAISQRAIDVIKTYGMIGVYVCEPAENIGQMSKEEEDFERFQFLQAFAVREELGEVIKTHRLHRLEYIADDIINEFSNVRRRIDFVQDVRSREDYIGKHSLNVAIIAAIIAGKQGYTMDEKRDLVHACLIHDIGKSFVPEKILEGETPDEVNRILDNSQDIGFELVDDLFPDNSTVKDICAETHRILKNHKYERAQDAVKPNRLTGIMLVAEMFESLTAMNRTGTKAPRSFVGALQYMYSYPEIFPKKNVDTLTDSIKTIETGITVLLSNGNRALVMTENPKQILWPTVLEFNTNKMIDLSDRDRFGDLSIADIVTTMDNRYSFK